MKRCIICKKPIKNILFDYCRACYKKVERKEDKVTANTHFENNLANGEIHTVYIMFYGSNDKIGYTRDLSSRMLEIKRDYPNNKLVYFREFMKETEARLFEVWLKKLSDRELNKFIVGFQDKVRRVEQIV